MQLQGFFLRFPLKRASRTLTKKALAHMRKGFTGWKTGFEPATSGTTIQRSNQLSYNHHLTLIILVC